jgi:hypothetical protein
MGAIQSATAQHSLGQSRRLERVRVQERSADRSARLAVGLRGQGSHGTIEKRAVLAQHPWPQHFLGHQRPQNHDL